MKTIGTVDPYGMDFDCHYESHVSSSRSRAVGRARSRRRLHHAQRRVDAAMIREDLAELFLEHVEHLAELVELLKAEESMWDEDGWLKDLWDEDEVA